MAQIVRTIGPTTSSTIPPCYRLWPKIKIWACHKIFNNRVPYHFLMRFFPNLESIYRMFISAEIHPSSVEDEIIFKQDMERLAQFFTNLSRTSSLNSDSIKVSELNQLLRPYQGLKIKNSQKQFRVASSQ